MNDEQAVVVPAVDTPHSTACVRSLGEQGIRTIAVSESERPPAAWSRYCDETIPITGPTESLDRYRDELLKVVRRPSVRAVIPMREADIYVLSRDKSDFAEHVEAVWPSFETLSAVHDREKLFAAAERADVPMPETALLTDVEDWDEELIVKARYALLTGEYLETVGPDEVGQPPKTTYVEPGSEPDEQTLREEMGHEPIVQEYVSGTEYTFRALYDDGEPVVTTQKQLLRGYKYPRGPSICHRNVDIPELEAVGTRLLDELGWHGMASVGFLRDDETGEFKLLEINPRFPASLPVDVHAGTDFPYYFWCLATGRRDRIDADYEVGTTSHLLRGELVHLHSVLTDDYPLADRPSVHGTVWDILSSLYRHPRFDYLRLDDPGPFLRDTLNTVGTVGSIFQRRG